MTLFRAFSLASMTLLAAPALAATSPFAVTPQAAPRATIMVTGAGTCAEDAAAAQAALAAQAGRAVGIVAADAGCGAARTVMRQAPDIAFARAPEFLDADPNAFIAADRESGIYVWDLDAYRVLTLTDRRVLGVFAEADNAAMIEAALAHLSAGGGYFLLVQADALDGAARAALAQAQAAGAEILTPGLLRNAEFLPAYSAGH